MFAFARDMESDDALPPFLPAYYPVSPWWSLRVAERVPLRIASERICAALHVHGYECAPAKSVLALTYCSRGFVLIDVRVFIEIHSTVVELVRLSGNRDIAARAWPTLCRAFDDAAVDVARAASPFLNTLPHHATLPTNMTSWLTQSSTRAHLECLMVLLKVLEANPLALDNDDALLIALVDLVPKMDHSSMLALLCLRMWLDGTNDSARVTVANMISLRIAPYDIVQATHMPFTGREAALVRAWIPRVLPRDVIIHPGANAATPGSAAYLASTTDSSACLRRAQRAFRKMDDDGAYAWDVVAELCCKPGSIVFVVCAAARNTCAEFHVHMLQTDVRAAAQFVMHHVQGDARVSDAAFRVWQANMDAPDAVHSLPDLPAGADALTTSIAEIEAMLDPSVSAPLTVRVLAAQTLRAHGLHSAFFSAYAWSDARPTGFAAILQRYCAGI